MQVDGDKQTYIQKGADEHLWVAGSGKGDECKRFCVMQLIIRFCSLREEEIDTANVETPTEAAAIGAARPRAGYVEEYAEFPNDPVGR